jgi:hypothetical protein
MIRAVTFLLTPAAHAGSDDAFPFGLKVMR